VRATATGGGGKAGEAEVSRRGADLSVRGAAHAFATFVAVAVTTTIVALSFALLAVRFVGLNAYVVQGGPTESIVPIGALVLTAPTSTPAIDTAWVAIPTLGYAVTYAEAYTSPILMGLVVWVLFVLAVRALESHMSTARRRLPA
jgi:hypothetical protein